MDAERPAKGPAARKLKAERAKLDAEAKEVAPQQNPGPPAWTSYVNVTSADGTAAAATANGGQVFMPPMDVMDLGRMAILADPPAGRRSIPRPLWLQGHHSRKFVGPPRRFTAGCHHPAPPRAGSQPRRDDAR